MSYFLTEDQGTDTLHASSFSQIHLSSTGHTQSQARLGRTQPHSSQVGTAIPTKILLHQTTGPSCSFYYLFFFLTKFLFYFKFSIINSLYLSICTFILNVIKHFNFYHLVYSLYLWKCFVKLLIKNIQVVHVSSSNGLWFSCQSFQSIPQQNKMDDLQ